MREHFNWFDSGYYRLSWVWYLTVFQFVRDTLLKISRLLISIDNKNLNTQLRTKKKTPKNSTSQPILMKNNVQWTCVHRFHKNHHKRAVFAFIFLLLFLIHQRRFAIILISTFIHFVAFSCDLHGLDIYFFFIFLLKSKTAGIWILHLKCHWIQSDLWNLSNAKGLNFT